MIDLTIHPKVLERTIERAREKNIILPTFAQMCNPELIPEVIQSRLIKVGLWDVDPINLFRITWKNAPKKRGGLYGGVNYIEIPKELTGVNARVVVLIGKWFPTGAHKVGASYACLAPRLITGQFDPTSQKAVWPSTGNYCRGGAYNSTLLSCESIAILPEGMSQERFDWLSTVAGEVIPTPGTESNVKEIYDKCWELEKARDNVVIFNQFDEFGNYLWHHEITGHAMEEVFYEVADEKSTFAGVALTTGSAGTIAAGDYLKKVFPISKIAASEALQCPTLLLNGFGEHRIEGIGDKHVPWIHNVKNTDLVIGVDDNIPMNLIRLFNEPKGQNHLRDQGVPAEFIEKLPLLGISGVANIISAIKFAKYFELSDRDVVMTVSTDSMEMYGSRLNELEVEFGKYSKEDAIKDYHRYLMGITTDYLVELTYQEKKRIHNLKYYTWVEQQGKDPRELDAQWYDPEYWEKIQHQTEEIDRLITEFNQFTDL